ncbi:cold-regulated protein 27-like isoform X1 [Diospyros lotus]|uniref:cold-regulated protein 27-like isoform X1 n=1 Tax=Diospyros lotus TaxID=55363 RepID=UPI0022531717|nr:cold-regulated protein 27-like isoform X1 [Diospyros lotus]
MEENSRPASPDLAAAESCGNRLTRATSVSSSSTLSVDSWKDFADRSASIRSCTTWTNEKHNLYLGALEASFVKQLHQSRGLLPWHLEQNTHDSSLYLQQPVDASYSSDQFTVLRDGSWQKINFETNQKVTSSRLFGRPHVSLPCSEADFHLVTESPWIHHCRCSGKHGTIISTDMLECSVSHNETVPLRGKRIFTHRLMCSEHKCACHKLRQDTVGSVAEVSDQNFVDEDGEETSNSLPRPKRSKLSAINASAEDQTGNPFAVEMSASSNTLSDREEQVRQECLSEEVEGSTFPKHNVKSFLRES